MGKQLVITEKPSVARDIAAALGGFSDGEGDWLESDDYVVTWAIGHLLELAEPKEYDTKWRSWSIKNLPIVPDHFEVRSRDGQKKRIDGIKKLGKRKDIDGLINACDAGREGELIFRRVIEYTGLDKQPHQRLWLQSMTNQAIRDAFDNLRPGSQLDTLGDAAWLRAVGDWLVGMNATRALTQRLKSRGERGSWSAGRVQTPTLNLMVQREREILAHEPRDYWVIEGDFTGGQVPHTWLGRLFDDGTPAPDDPEYKPGRLFDRERAVALLDALKKAPQGSATEKRRDSKQNPPLPFDLTSLQREANKRYSMSARRTLDAAQRLYEGHKLLTYPRTDSRHLPDDYGPTVTSILTDYATLKANGPWGELAALAGKIGAAGPLNLGRVLDSTKVSDHFAIVPTGTLPGEELHGDDLRVYELVVRQFFAALMGPATFAVVERIVEVDFPGQEKPARFRTSAKSLEIPGFLEALGQQAGQGTTLPALVPGDDNPSGIVVDVTEVREDAKQTRPPSRYSEAQLLRMMETAGELIEDDELSEAMQGRGLGTPATRADTIERLVKTVYARRVEGRLAPTSKAMRLMDILERVDAAGLASAKLTGEWQYQLDRVEKGEVKREDVESDLADYTRAVVESLVGFEHENLYQSDDPIGTCPECGAKVRESAWGYPCEKNTGKDSECSFMIWKDRSGRYIDRKLAAKLIAERTVGPVDGFVARGARQFSSGILNLVQDKEAGRWNLDIQWGENAGVDEEEVVGDPIFDCPEHEGCKIIETNLRYVCEKMLKGEERRGPVLPKLVCQREMSPEEIAPFFSEEGKTETMGGFISRRGREFRGLLFRKPTGKHGFEFPPREKKEKKPAAKKATTAKKTTAKKATTAKKTTAKKPAAKKATTAKKTTAKKATPAKKAAADETAETKPAAKKPAAKKATTAKKTTAKKPAAKKATTAKKTTAKKASDDTPAE